MAYNRAEKLRRTLQVHKSHQRHLYLQRQHFPYLFLKLIAIAIIFLELSTEIFSQPQTEWVQRYTSPGSLDDYVVDMAIDKSGNVYLTGYTVVTGSDYDILTTKYNSAGILQWARTYGGRANRYDAPVGIEMNDSGNIYVAGSSIDTAGSIDFILIKYNSNGDSLFVRRYNNTNYAYASAMCMDPQGNIFISGDGESCDSCESGYMTAKINSDGTLQWFRFYTGPGFGSDLVRDIISDSVGNVYVTGMAQGTLGTVTIKYSSDGDSIWLRQSLNGGNLLQVNSSTLYLLEAYRRIIKYDLDGNLYWTSNADGSYYDLQVDDSNYVYISGGNSGFAVTKKLSSNGDSVWQKEFKAVSNSSNVLKSLAFDSTFNLFTTGHTTYNSPWDRFMTISYSRQGQFIWSVYYNNNTPFLQHEGIKVKTDKFGNILVAGNSQGNGTGYDIAVIKYSRLTEIVKSSTEIPSEFKLFQNFPNPFNSVTNIKYDVPSYSDIKILITDISGKEVFELSNVNHPPGIFSFEFNGDNFPSGTYFISMIARGKLIKTNKLILLK